jgi:hypothetical protein
MRRVSGQRIRHGSQALAKIRVILKVQSEGADRSDALGDACGSDGSGEVQRICRHRIEGQQGPTESELVYELCQPFL